MKKLATLCLVLLAVGTASANSMNLNFDPDGNPPPPILDAGWFYDQIDAAFVNSIDSPYVYDLAAPAVFRITDAFVVGDTFFVYDFGSLILTTAPLAGAPTGFGGSGEAEWQSLSYSSGEVLLGAGAHSLTVQGDGVGGVPAGFYTQLTSASVVPAPGAILLAGLGAGFVGWLRRRNTL